MPYEKALGELEQLLEAVEGGDIPLADLVEKFATGSRLLKVCETRLREAELKIEQLSAREGETTFETVEEEAS